MGKISKLCNRNLSILQNLRDIALFLLHYLCNNIILVSETKGVFYATIFLGGIL